MCAVGCAPELSLSIARSCDCILIGLRVRVRMCAFRGLIGWLRGRCTACARRHSFARYPRGVTRRLRSLPSRVNVSHIYTASRLVYPSAF